MTRFWGLVSLFPALPVLLTHLAGMVVAIILLVRQRGKRTAGILALVGFALLVVFDLASFTQGGLIRFLSRRTAASVRLAHISVGCCCNILDMAAVVCIIVAIWQAMSGVGMERGGMVSEGPDCEQGDVEDR